jgi:hypothetical protein
MQYDCYKNVYVALNRDNLSKKKTEIIYIGLESSNQSSLKCTLSIRLDGCFLKRYCDGLTLAVIYSDQNVQMLSVVIGVVER